VDQKTLQIIRHSLKL